MNLIDIRLTVVKATSDTDKPYTTEAVKGFRLSHQSFNELRRAMQNSRRGNELSVARKYIAPQLNNEMLKDESITSVIFEAKGYFRKWKIKMTTQDVCKNQLSSDMEKVYMNFGFLYQGKLVSLITATVSK